VLCHIFCNFFRYLKPYISRRPVYPSVFLYVFTFCSFSPKLDQFVLVGATCRKIDKSTGVCSKCRWIFFFHMLLRKGVFNKICRNLRIALTEYTIGKIQKIQSSTVLICYLSSCCRCVKLADVLKPAKAAADDMLFMLTGAKRWALKD